MPGPIPNLTRAAIVIHPQMPEAVPQADLVAASLREVGLKVDLRLIREVESLEQYQAVVLGAAIYNAKWHADARDRQGPWRPL